MPKLILLRHLESQWNKENRFTGWVDVPLSKEGAEGAKELADKFSQIKIDVVYTSPLARNKETVLRIFQYLDKYPIFIHFKGKMKNWAKFQELNKNYLPVYVAEELNERYYGKLQGLNKEETMKKYGKKQVHLWRRGFKTVPPGGESLKDVCKRVIPFYRKYIEKDLKKGKNILIIASHNSLRALVKYLDNISDENIANFEIPTGSIKKYEIKKTISKLKKKIL